MNQNEHQCITETEVVELGCIFPQNVLEADRARRQKNLPTSKGDKQDLRVVDRLLVDATRP